MMETIYACCVLHNICLDVGDIEAVDDNDDIGQYEDFVESDTRLSLLTITVHDDANNGSEGNEAMTVSRSNQRFDLVVNRFLNEL